MTKTVTVLTLVFLRNGWIDKRQMDRQERQIDRYERQIDRYERQIDRDKRDRI